MSTSIPGNRHAPGTAPITWSPAAADLSRTDLARVDRLRTAADGAAAARERPTYSAQAYATRPGIVRPIVVMLGLLVLAGLTQEWVVLQRAAVIVQEPQFSSELAYKMPALVLTGLRGPLVTTLWLAAEKGKNERDWEALQTYYGAIGALQPHFAQGYLMNGWNSAYNMSVQFNSLPYKYRWIRKGIALVEEGDRRNPDNVDLVGYLSDLYGDKLGRSQEREYYFLRFRDETRGFQMPPLPPDKSRRFKSDQETGEANGEPFPPPTNPDGSPVRDADLDGITTFPVGEKFPFGIHPLGVGWWYAEKCRRLQAATGARHHQFGAPVISSRPSLMVRDWAYRTHELARHRARELFGGQPYELAYFAVLENEKQQALRRRSQRQLIDEARWHYRFADKLLEMLPGMYQEHIRRFAFRFLDDSGLYTRHTQNAWFDRQIIIANAEAFEALLIVTGRAPGTIDDVIRHFRASEQHYQAAIGDIHRYDLNNPTAWKDLPDIGMAAYMEVHLPAGDPVSADNRADVQRDIAYYRSMQRIVGVCWREADARRDEPISQTFTPSLNLRLVKLLVFREPPEPMGL